MPSKDSTHFQQYTEQNHVKHEILSKYFGAYLRALSKYARAFHYIDGFAGRGSYDNGAPGSPIIALDQLLAQNIPATISLVESNAKHYQELVASVANHGSTSSLIAPTLILYGELQDHIKTILAHPIYKSFRPVATFAFIDPCGVKGVRLEDIVSIMKLQFGECLLFWNYDGLNRWIGGVASQTHPADRLQPMFGAAVVQRVLDIVQSIRNSNEKERQLRQLFMECITERSGAKFILPFRFQARGSSRTSHYLIHCTQNALGFKIMKDIMGSAASGAGDTDIFEFLGGSDLSDQLSMLLPAVDESARRAILAHLASGPQFVSEFTQQWVMRPRDFLTGKDYKRLLIDLERSGDIEVINPNDGLPKPAALRTRSGKVTLSDALSIRLRPKNNRD